MVVSKDVLQVISTPTVVSTPIGELEFVDGIATDDTVRRLYDHQDLLRGVDAFTHALPGVSMQALRTGFRAAGVEDNQILLFSELMDCDSLFLTANADNIYFWGYLDLEPGPLVVHTPRDVLGVIDDMWFRWITDFGLPGPDRGAGGTYLLVPPGYTGPLPEGGMFVHRSRTNRVALIGRAFLQDDDPAAPVARIKQELKISRYTPGGYGTSIGSFLQGRAPLARLAEPEPARFLEGSGRAMNTIPPADFSFFTMLDTLVQDEPAEALDPEIAGHAASIGIIKGHRYDPDQRMRAILAHAATLGNATARMIGSRPRAQEGFAYYGPSSAWGNPLFVGGYDWTRPPPEITGHGVEPHPATGARTLNARTAFFYYATVVTPAMCMRLTGLGSQYLAAFLDSRSRPFDGACSYTLTLPPGIPAAKFWSLTVYDNQTRSMLPTDQRYPRAGSQDYPTPAAQPDADGSTTVHFAPRRPDGVAPGNWIQTLPGKGWFVILRLYSPEQTFFDKTWRPGEIQPI